MSKIKETIQQKLPEYLLAALIGAIGYLLATIWKEISLPLIQTVLPELSKTGLLAIILIQFLVILGTVAYILFTRNKRRKYRFDKRLGIYFHNKTGEPFCTSCLTATPCIESPLEERKNGWYCLFKPCEKFYKNPDYEKPQSPPRHNNWKIL